MGLMHDKALWLTLFSGSLAPRILLSASIVLETAVGGDLVGQLRVANGSGVYTFTITSDPDNKFALDGTDSSLLEVEALATFTAGSTHLVTIEADNGVDAVVSATFAIGVVAVATSGPTGDGIQLETGDFLLAENGDYLIQEAA